MKGRRSVAMTFACLQEGAGDISGPGETESQVGYGQQLDSEPSAVQNRTNQNQTSQPLHYLFWEGMLNPWTLNHC